MGLNSFFELIIRKSADMQMEMLMLNDDEKVLVGAVAGVAGAVVYRHLRGGELTLSDVLLGAAGGLAGMVAPDVLDLGPGYHAGAALVPMVNPMGRIADRARGLDWIALLTTSYHAGHYGRLALVAVNALPGGR